MRSAVCAACLSCKSGSSTANSSPPKRATRSVGRKYSRSASATAIEHAVAGDVAVLVVECFEVVDVDHHQAQRLLAVQRARHLALEHRPHPMPVAQARQRVGVRVALGLAQHAEAARDVLVVGAHALREHDEQVLAERVRAIDHAATAACG